MLRGRILRQSGMCALFDDRRDLHKSLAQDRKNGTQTERNQVE